MKCLILISAPGAGKGTVSDYIKNNHNIDHISTGHLLREQALSDEKLNKILEKGSFVSDEILIDILDKRLTNQKDNFILDGTPRILEQAKLLDLLFEKLNIDINKVIFINIDKDIALNRIINRKVCNKCNRVYNNLKDNLTKCEICGNILVKRSDDNIQTFLKRYEKFNELTLPILDYYKDKVVMINNNKDISYLYKEVDKVLKGDDINDND